MTTADVTLMGTGHRKVDNPELVRCGLRDLIVNVVKPDAVRSGGAEGFDTLLALAAIDAGVPLLIDLPNRYYRDVYTSVTDEILSAAAAVRVIVERPECNNWRFRWGAERWWVDNHTRNHAMVSDSHVAVVGSGIPPLPLAMEKGGTAECVRYIVRHSTMPGVWWLPLADPVHEWVPIERQGVLL